MADVTRRWQICPQQVFTWRHEMRTVAPAPLDFVLIVPALPAPVAAPASSSPAIKMQLRGATLRIAPGTEAALLPMALRALRSSAA